MRQEIVNATDVAKLCRADDTFVTIARDYGVPPNWRRTPGFASLCRIVLGQQISLASASAHFKKLHSCLPEFTPTGIALLSDEEMRECHISRQKARYLRALATAINNGHLVLEQLEPLGDEEIYASLTAIKGVGKWTADIYLMFCLQRKDIFPAGDIAVVNAAKDICRITTKEELAVLSEQWRPLRSLATYFLWHYYINTRKRNRRDQTQ